MIRNSFRFALPAMALVWVHGAFAVCVNGHPSPQQEYENSVVVFVGRVVSEESTPVSKKYLDGITYSLNVQEILRGTSAKTFRLFSENSSGRFPMRVGATYLVFAYEALGRLMVDNCGNSGELSEKTKLLSVLRNIKSRELNKAPSQRP